MDHSAKVSSLRAALAAARATVSSIEAALAQAESAGSIPDVPVPLDVAAERCHCSPTTIRRWALTGRVPASRGARKKILVRVSDVARALEQDPVTPRAAAAANDSVEQLDALEAALRDGSLVARGKR